MLEFLEWLTNYLKYRRDIGIGRTITPKLGVPAGVTMLPHHSIYTLAVLAIITGNRVLIPDTNRRIFESAGFLR